MNINNFYNAILKFVKGDNFSYCILFFAAMLYVTCKLVCNPLFFRQVDIHFFFSNTPLKLNSAAFVYPGIYVLSDLIVVLSSRRFGILIAFFGIICDGIFSFTVSHISGLPLPSTMSKTELLSTTSVNTLGLQMWPLYYQGVIAATIAAIAEILIFSTIFKRLDNFVIATVTSVVITLVFHNLINDYQMLKNEPDVWRLIINNWMVNITILFVYAVIIAGVRRTIKIWQSSN
ncbi:MAG: hypothetical protein K0R14_1131 [Burkholderiales bacterium]|jgi:hypothetical protein|nr:hypothetical protein [Burkholderiales bacterium]